jgi:proline iminopeptidase
MDPKEIEKMGQLIPGAQVLMCRGSHMSLWDDQQRYMEGVIKFLKETEAKRR